MNTSKNTKCQRYLLSLITIIMTLIAGSAHAEYLGLPNGRLGIFNPDETISVELGIVTGKLDGANYDNPGIRINYLVKKDIQLFVDLNRTSVGKSDEISYGLGAFYSLGKIFDFSEFVTLKGSIHTIKLSRHINGGISTECTGSMPVTNPIDGSLTIDPGYCYPIGLDGSSSSNTVRIFAVELLFGGKPIPQLEFKGNVASWYFNIGAYSFQGSDIGSKLGAGGGLVLPVGPGELYTGIDHIGELLFGIGYRYFLR